MVCHRPLRLSRLSGNTSADSLCSLRFKAAGKVAREPEEAPFGCNACHEPPARLLRRYSHFPSLLEYIAERTVMTAEHVKWSTHLVGGAQLLAELDFPALTQEVRRLKAAQNAQESRFLYQNPDMLIDQKKFDQKLKQNMMMPDESLVSTIVGKKVSYDDFGRIIEDADMRQEKKSGLLDKLDLRTYETLQDLYWWYARQDAFQSMVSGNPLM